MKLFQKCWDVLSSKKRIKLKKSMGLPITLSDIEQKPITKHIMKLTKKR